MRCCPPSIRGQRILTNFRQKYPGTSWYLGPGYSGARYSGTQYFSTLETTGMTTYYPPIQVPWAVRRTQYFFCGTFELGVKSTELWELLPSPSVEVEPWLLDCWNAVAYIKAIRVNNRVACNRIGVLWGYHFQLRFSKNIGYFVILRFLVSGSNAQHLVETSTINMYF